MKVPFLDLKAQYHSIKEEVNEAIQDVLENTAFILGKSVSEFERKFAEAHNVEHCFGTSSGTDGNHMALWALGVGPGDEVIIPANTFIATAWGATLCGAKPVFVDCDSKTYNLDPAKIEAAITDKTKAIVAVHLYGQPADMDAILAIGEKHEIPIVEDAAQAHLAEYNGNPVGSMGLISSFSFYPGKNLGAYGEGGAVVTNNDELAAQVKMIREQGQSKKYYHDVYGHNYRMEGIQGAVLNVKMGHIVDWTEARRRVAKGYNELLNEIDEIILPYENEKVKHSYHLFVIKVKNGRREELQNFLNENGVAAGLHYPVPLHLQKCFEHLGYKKGDFPNTEELADQCLSLPMFPEMTNEQIKIVSDTIHEFYNK